MGKPLIDVLTGRRPERRPVWLMRQAGRYLPEYRALRQQAGSFLGLCYDPELAAEVTLQPLRRFDLDAAIVFSDILVVPHAMGLALDFVEGEGPKLETVGDVASVRKLGLGADAYAFGQVYETLRRTKRELGPSQALIGFCGAPWTVASYMIEGGSSERRKALAAATAGEAWFAELMERLVAVSVSYLVGQVKAGAGALQIFDSWAGDLPEGLRASLVFEPIKAIVNGVRTSCGDVPIIAFARGIGRDHGVLAEKVRASAVGVEEHVRLDETLRSLAASCAIQGNLSPQALLAGGNILEQETRRILAQVPASRHVFNLGHGIVPATPPEHVTELLSIIRGLDGSGK